MGSEMCIRDRIPACYYAPLGCEKVSLAVRAVQPVRTGADHFLEVAFTAGSLAVGATASMDQLAVRTNSGTFNQSNDHSFLNASSFTQNSKVTVYVGGTLVFGTEPAVAPVRQSVGVDYANLDVANPTDANILPQLRVNNTGSADVALRNLTLRYWFTRDTTGQLYTACNYAQIGCGAVTTRIVSVSPKRTGADSYLEVAFSGGTLAVGGTTGPLQLQVRKDPGTFYEPDDYSFGPHGSFATTSTVTAYLNGTLVWGKEP